MKVFVTGVCGQLGHDCMNELISRGHQAVGSDILAKDIENYYQLDITNKTAVEDLIKEIKPDAIIHCAAWSAVDAAEDDENREKVENINHFGTKYLALSAKNVNSKMLYLSTDYVFDG
ncbi:MAG: sugar nucleotide-binding protein, partial [Synergistaceae bacterium]|nr:sugar nucleotide-binding protein [Synergistaceae bacterium]